MIKKIAAELEFNKALREALGAVWKFHQVMVPAMLLAKGAEALGLITFFSRGLAPLMELLGLPGAMAFAWASALLVNLYSGVAVTAALLPSYPLDDAQITVLGSLILLAHGLPVENGLFKKAGINFFASCVLRLLLAFAYGIILHRSYVFLKSFSATHVAATAPLSAAPSALSALAPPLSFAAWLLESAWFLSTITFIIIFLFFVVRIMEITGLMKQMERLLWPVLSRLKINQKAAAPVSLGMLLGISYSSGLFLSGRYQLKHCPRKEIFLVSVLLFLSHSLIEDTLLLFALGADLSGILFGRVLFTGCVMVPLGHFVYSSSSDWFMRLFLPEPKVIKN